MVGEIWWNSSSPNGRFLLGLPVYHKKTSMILIVSWYRPCRSCQWHHPPSWGWFWRKTSNPLNKNDACVWRKRTGGFSNKLKVIPTQNVLKQGFHQQLVNHCIIQSHLLTRKMITSSNDMVLVWVGIQGIVEGRAHLYELKSWHKQL